MVMIRALRAMIRYIITCSSRKVKVHKKQKKKQWLYVIVCEIRGISKIWERTVGGPDQEMWDVVIPGIGLSTGD